MSFLRPHRRAPSIFGCAVGAVLLGASSALLGVCGPFTDVAADSFCPFVLELFTLGITTGTTPTTHDPASSVSRLQMAAFLSRSVDGVLKRGSRRAPLDQFWTTQNAGGPDSPWLLPDRPGHDSIRSLQRRNQLLDHDDRHESARAVLKRFSSPSSASLAPDRHRRELSHVPRVRWREHLGPQPGLFLGVRRAPLLGSRPGDADGQRAVGSPHGRRLRRTRHPGHGSVRQQRLSLEGGRPASHRPVSDGTRQLTLRRLQRRRQFLGRTQRQGPDRPILNILPAFAGIDGAKGSCEEPSQKKQPRPVRLQ